MTIDFINMIGRDEMDDDHNRFEWMDFETILMDIKMT